MERVKFSDIIKDLISNELLEIDIPPTRTLSGIKRSEFSKLVSEFSCNNNSFRQFGDLLKKIFSENFSNIPIYFITVPNKYEKYICECIHENLAKVG